MLGFYMDDSADQKKEIVFSVAGFVIKAGDTFETERPWNARLEREGIRITDQKDRRRYERI